MVWKSLHDGSEQIIARSTELCILPGLPLSWSIQLLGGSGDSAGREALDAGRLEVKHEGQSLGGFDADVCLPGEKTPFVVHGCLPV